MIEKLVPEQDNKGQGGTRDEIKEDEELNEEEEMDEKETD